MKEETELTDTFSTSSHLNEDVATDFALLTRCKHFILTYGTFGMWAALLSAPEVGTERTETKRRMVLMPSGYSMANLMSSGSTNDQDFLEV